ncbi:MAG TPA: MBL fold metallo-hydrolase [Burkholderiales bacterium]|nr:MBL fold metallo-hydrolase [Burkholderiales bacterium]
MDSIKLDGYEIDVLIQGFPGRMVCHGGLGWSTVALIRGEGHVALVDVGSFNMRKGIIEQLAKRDLEPADVTDVILTHSHYDHSLNWIMFRQARIIIGARELAWSLNEPWGSGPVPELYMRELENWPTLHPVAAEQEFMPGLKAHAAPGHTPGHLVFVLSGKERDAIFTGDAAKNRAELLSRKGDATYDAAQSSATIRRIWQLWQKQPGSFLIPGHDLPMTQKDGRIEYVGKRKAALKAWFGEDLEATTLIELSVR